MFGVNWICDYYVRSDDIKKVRVKNGGDLKRTSLWKLKINYWQLVRLKRL